VTLLADLLDWHRREDKTRTRREPELP